MTDLFKADQPDPIADYLANMDDCMCKELGFKCEWCKVQEIYEDFQAEKEQLERWVEDLQSGMYINCVYCGHRYGPEDEVPATMADALKEHIEQCPKHPMSKLKAELDEMRRIFHICDDHKGLDLELLPHCPICVKFEDSAKLIIAERKLKKYEEKE